MNYTAIHIMNMCLTYTSHYSVWCITHAQSMVVITIISIKRSHLHYIWGPKWSGNQSPFHQKFTDFISFICALLTLITTWFCTQSFCRNGVPEGSLVLPSTLRPCGPFSHWLNILTGQKSGRPGPSCSHGGWLFHLPNIKFLNGIKLFSGTSIESCLYHYKTDFLMLVSLYLQPHLQP